MEQTRGQRTQCLARGRNLMIPRSHAGCERPQLHNVSRIQPLLFGENLFVLGPRRTGFITGRTRRDLPGPPGPDLAVRLYWDWDSLPHVTVGLLRRVGSSAITGHNSG
eukprot:767781-Hanusia_phi.AAC.5